MDNRIKSNLVASIMLIATCAAPPVVAAEIHVLSAAVMQPVFSEIGDDFERVSGHKLVIAYGTMGAIPKRLQAGEAADVVIGSATSMAQLVKEGRIRAESTRNIARVGVGVVAPVGTPKPAIGTVDELRQALLGASQVVYADPDKGGAAGIYVARMIEKLGLTGALKAKTRYGTGGDITELTLAQGPGALGLTQISEIVAKRGAVFVGPLPEELQNYTGITAGTPLAASREQEAARAFIDYLKSTSAILTIREGGMQPAQN
jgi:molybdate transport system substrate-binding protein